jgi:hypothetical protein
VLRELEISRRVNREEPPPEPPDGIVLVEIAERPDLLRAAYALACEALPQMPLHAPLEMPSYERWLEEEATGPDVLEGGTLLALDGERVVGFVSLLRRAAIRGWPSTAHGGRGDAPQPGSRRRARSHGPRATAFAS